MIISSPGATQRDSLRLTIEATIRKWAKALPAEVLQFEEQMKQARELRAGDRLGLSGRDLSKYGEIPATLYHGISRAVGSPYWHHDPATREIFWGMFQVGKIRRGARLPTHE